jgi:Ala-tRNA(Pro) deacylase
VTATPDDLFAYLDRFGIAHRTIAHPPMFTVEDGRPWHDKMPGLHCKNLFLKDKTGKIWLVVMPGDKRADLKALAKKLESSGQLSFGRPELLLEVLGITPGAVTPFALLNDTARRVAVVLDQTMMQSDRLNFHPLHNAASTCILGNDLRTFIASLGYSPIEIDCGA